jgi:hypothetical protein
MDPQEYLRRSSPLALRWALVQRFQQHHINDLAHVIKLVQENGKDIPKSHVQKSGKIDNGSFGSIFKATYKGRLFVMKCIGQVGKFLWFTISRAVFLFLTSAQ